MDLLPIAVCCSDTRREFEYLNVVGVEAVVFVSDVYVWVFVMHGGEGGRGTS